MFSAADNMAMIRRVPWRKLKTLAVVCALLAFIHVVWSFSGISSVLERSADSQSQHGVLKFRSNGQLLPQLIRTKSVCKKVVPFETRGGGVISTYDLPKEADYSLDKNGRYKIPQEFYDNEKNPLQHETSVILVPFSHADPGYGMTFEQYYSSRIKCEYRN